MPWRRALALLALLGTGCAASLPRIPPPLPASAPPSASEHPPAEALEQFGLALQAELAGDYDAARGFLAVALLFDPRAAALHEALGRVELARGRAAEARAALERAAQLAPADPETRRLLALACERDGDPTEAVRQLELLLAAGRDDEAFLALCRMLFAHAERDAARAAMLRWCTALPEPRDLLYERAALRLLLGDPGGAWDDLAELLGAARPEGPALDLFAEATAASRRFLSGLLLLERLCAIEPGDETLLVRLRSLAARAGDHERAAAAWTRLDRLRGGRDAGAKVLLAQALLELSQPAQALAALDAAATLAGGPDPGDPLRVRALSALGRNEEALALLAGSSAWADERARLHERAALLEAAGRLEEARDALRQALPLEQGWYDPWRLASLEARCGDLAQARALLATRREGTDELAEALAEARLLDLAGQGDAALAVLAAAEARWPGEPRPALERAERQRQAQGSAAAAALLEAARARNPESAALAHALALLYADTGRAALGAAMLRELLARSPDEAELLNDLAYLAVEAGERSEDLLDMARRAVDQEPGNAAFLDTLGWVLLSRGDAAGALVELEHAARLSPGDPVIAAHLQAAQRAAPRGR